MAEGSSGEKTEEPTPKRLRDARQKGQVAKSKEVAGTLGLIVLISFIWLRMESFQQDFIQLYEAAASAAILPFDAGLIRLGRALRAVAMSTLAPIIAITILVAIVGNVIQVGVIFSMQAVMPNLNKLNPAQGIKKIISPKNFMNFGKDIIKVLLLGAIIFIVVRDGIGDLVRSGACGLGCSSAVFASMLGQMIAFSMGVFVLSAAVDYGLERWQYIKGLKMTKDEVKREYKETEGDPYVKGRRKQLHRELLTGSTVGATRKATAVVTNPTHIAVALRYDRNEAPLPLVIAKGADLTAQEIMAVAEDNDVPIVQNIDLARALYDQVEIDAVIPSELIEPVAEVLRWVRRLARERDGI